MNNFKSPSRMELMWNQTGCRDDTKFLFHSTRAVRFFHENGELSFLKFQKIPNICNARWNSQAILAFLTYFFMPQVRKRLQMVCQFISYDWADQMYRPEDYEEL